MRIFSAVCDLSGMKGKGPTTVSMSAVGFFFLQILKNHIMILLVTLHVPVHGRQFTVNLVLEQKEERIMGVSFEGFETLKNVKDFIQGFKSISSILISTWNSFYYYTVNRKLRTVNDSHSITVKMQSKTM